MRNLRSKLPAALLMLALAATLVACGGDDDSTTEATTGQGSATTGTETPKPSPEPEPSVETIVVNDGAPVGGPQTLEFDAGEEVRFRVRSNTADELHIHGYDVTKDLRPGRTAMVSFPADIEGIFEAELHGSGELIAELQINP